MFPFTSYRISRCLLQIITIRWYWIWTDNLEENEAENYAIKFILY